MPRNGLRGIGCVERRQPQLKGKGVRDEDGAACGNHRQVEREALPRAEVALNLGARGATRSGKGGLDPLLRQHGKLHRRVGVAAVEERDPMRRAVALQPHCHLPKGMDNQGGGALAVPARPLRGGEAEGKRVAPRAARGQARHHDGRAELARRPWRERQPLRRQDHPRGVQPLHPHLKGHRQRAPIFHPERIRGHLLHAHPLLGRSQLTDVEGRGGHGRGGAPSGRPTTDDRRPMTDDRRRTTDDGYE